MSYYVIPTPDDYHLLARRVNDAYKDIFGREPINGVFCALVDIVEHVKLHDQTVITQKKERDQIEQELNILKRNSCNYHDLLAKSNKQKEAFDKVVNKGYEALKAKDRINSRWRELYNAFDEVNAITVQLKHENDCLFRKQSIGAELLKERGDQIRIAKERIKELENTIRIKKNSITNLEEKNKKLLEQQEMYKSRCVKAEDEQENLSYKNHNIVKKNTVLKKINNNLCDSIKSFSEILGCY